MSEAQNIDTAPPVCCETMQEALQGNLADRPDLFNPTFFRGDDGTVMLPVGYLPITDEVDRTRWVDVSWLDFHARFCPFCGSTLPPATPPTAMN